MKCAVYCRVSTEEQANGGHSIEAQQQELTKYCQAFDMEIYGFYIDAGYSASTMERPELRRMLQDADNYDVALVWRLDRISRDMSDLMKILEVFQNHHIVFKSKMESFDTSTASGKLMLNVLGSFAEFERASISDRIKMAHRKILNEGKWRGGSPPFGYRVSENKSLAIDEEEVRIVRLAFEWSANKNMGSRSIAIELNKQGFKTRNRKAFTGDYIARLLKNPTYYGEMVYGRQKYVKRNGRKQCERVEDFETYRGLFDPIISKDTFLQSIKNMEERKSNRGSSGSVPNPIGGLIYCGDCKDYMLRSVKGEGERFFVCRRYKHYGECSHHFISEDRVMKEIKKMIMNLEIDTNEIDKINTQLLLVKDVQMNELQARIKALKKQLEQNDFKEDTLFELAEKRLVTEEDFVKRRKKLEQERTQGEKLLKELEAKADKIGASKGDPESMLCLRPFDEVFDSLLPRYQKMVLRSIIERIEVMQNDRPYARKKIHIYFKL